MAFYANIPVLRETADWLAVSKPAGLLVHPTRPDGTITLLGLLRQWLACEQAGGGAVSLAQRLDRETSGVILAAKSSSAARCFGRQLERGEMRKEYRAIVFGWPEWEERTSEGPLLRAGSRGPSAVWLRQCIHPEGAQAATTFRVLRRFVHGGHPLALLAAVPRSGRMHQIRVHAASLGHPLVGDKLYGSAAGHEQWYLRFIAEGWTSDHAAALLLPRHALHAQRLEFAAPGGSWIRVEAPPPEDFAALIGSE